MKIIKYFVLISLLALILCSSGCISGSAAPIPELDREADYMSRRAQYGEYNIDSVEMYEDGSLIYFRIGNFSYVNQDLIPLFEFVGGEPYREFKRGRNKVLSSFVTFPTGGAMVICGIVFSNDLEDAWSGLDATVISAGSLAIAASIGMIVWAAFDYEDAAELYNEWLKDELGMSEDVEFSVDITTENDEARTGASVEIRF